MKRILIITILRFKCFNEKFRHIFAFNLDKNRIKTWRFLMIWIQKQNQPKLLVFTPHTVHFITLSKNKGTQYDWQKGKISYLWTLPSIHKHIDVNIDKVVVFNLYMRTLHLKLLSFSRSYWQKRFLECIWIFQSSNVFSHITNLSQKENFTKSMRVKDN